MNKLKLPLLVLGLCLAAVGHADLNAGLAAFDAKDYATAVKELKPLADKGNTTAEIKMSLMYANGSGVTRSMDQAIALLTKAAQAGDAQGQNLLGLAYFTGQGVGRDFDQSFAWFQKSAAQGYAGSEAMVGIMYRQGLSVGRDYVQAASWFSKAAQQNHVSGLASLGGAYAHGQGITHDLVLAYTMYSLGDKAGDSTCAQLKKMIAEHLNPAQLAEGDALAAAWKVGTPLPTSSKTGVIAN